VDVRVSVPQSDGEIRIATDGNEPDVYVVTDGQVDVDEAKVVRFLTVIDGSSVVQDVAGTATVDVTEAGTVVEVAGSGEARGDGAGEALPAFDPANPERTYPGFGPQED
jgi:hypothetical protein